MKVLQLLLVCVMLFFILMAWSDEETVTKEWSVNGANWTKSTAYLEYFIGNSFCDN